MGIFTIGRRNGSIVAGRQRNWQRAAVDLVDQVDGVIGGEVSVDDAAAVGDRLIDGRCGNHLAVHKDRDAAANLFSGRIFPGLLRLLLKGQRNRRGHLSGLGVGVKKQLRVVHVVAGQERVARILTEHAGIAVDRRARIKGQLAGTAQIHHLIGRLLARLERKADHNVLVLGVEHNLTVGDSLVDQPLFHHRNRFLQLLVGHILAVRWGKDRQGTIAQIHSPLNVVQALQVDAVNISVLRVEAQKRRAGKEHQNQRND